MARLSGEQEALVRLDPLSGLLSRRALAAEITDLIAETARHRGQLAEHQFALMIIDLDHFKNVNDALGHAVGDQLLAEVARRLAEAVRPGDIVARLGGDEFAVVAARMPNIGQAQAIAARIGKQLREPIYLEGLPLDASASIGVAMYPVDGEDVITLMRHADVAMYAAKRHNAEVAIYSPGTDNNSADRLGLLADLRLALEDPDHQGEIRLVYQPQVAIDTGEVVGVEALLRWHHPVRGSVSPTEIVRTAEHSAVMMQLTFRVIDETFAQVAAWRSAGIRLRASINVSVRDLHSNDIVEHLRRGLTREGIGAGDIEIEITETALMADPERVFATVHQLAHLGVALSLDDFGTGYSSLLHLRELPLREVKIDQSFVRSMAQSPTDRAIVRSIIELSHALGLRVVAEGVEDAHIARLLSVAGCDLAQGWHYGAPMSPDVLVAWLAERS
jgi:diguanylate cyclase (GGDEF)-like protein